MAAPLIQFDLIAQPSGPTIDLTALTGGNVGTEQLAGFVGKDWNLAFADFSVQKFGGGEQLNPTKYGPFTNGNGTLPYTISVSDKDAGQDGYGTPESWNSSASQNFLDATTGAGCKLNPFADQKLRVLTWIGATYGGPFTVTATPSDARHAAVSRVLPVNGNGSFTCTYRCVEPDSTIEIKIEKTGTNGTGNSAYLWQHFVYIGDVTDPPRSSSFVHYMLRNAGT